MVGMKSKPAQKRASKKKVVKPVRLENKAKIRRRLFKLWSAKVQLLHNECCAISSTRRGSIMADGKSAILDCHHLENRITCPALRYDALNGILLTKSYHKFGKNSAHKGAIWFSEWLRENRPEQLKYVLEHRNDPIDLNDRATLAEIEAKLRAPVTADELKILGYNPAQIAERLSNVSNSNSDAQ